MRIAVALSGGVDSSVTCMLLKDRGHEVIAVTFDLGEHTKNAVTDARKVADYLGIEHVVLDYRKPFEEIVVADFMESYLKGKTPNPCVVCNENIKFGLFMEFAKSRNCDKVATGHYARTTFENGKNYITKASDLKKDQSYALYRLTSESVGYIYLPIEGMTKLELRALASERGLPVAHRPDSQDVCFIPEGSHGEYIESRCKNLSKEGYFVDVNGKRIAKHKGVYNYTIGQRKGLGVSLGKYAYVKEIDGENGDVVLTTDESDLYTKEVYIENVAGADIESIFERNTLTAKLRYAHQPAEVIKVSHHKEGVLVEFKEAQRAPTFGQSLVFYSEDKVLGGGIITPFV